MTESTNNQQSNQVVYRGVLRLLEKEGISFQRHNFDPEELRATKALLRSRNRQRSENLHNTTITTILPNLEECLKTTEFTLIFFFHPQQPHSLQLRSIVAEFCNKYKDKVFCLALFGGDPNAATTEELGYQTLFFKGTGFYQIVRNEVGNQVASSLLSFLDVTQIPSVVVLPNSTGRPILGQEVAMNWNASGEESPSAPQMMERWRSGGRSGLSLSQTILSKTLGDSASVCSVM